MPQMLPASYKFFSRSTSLFSCVRQCSMQTGGPVWGGLREDLCSLTPQKRRLDRLVCQPLHSLSDMLVGPQQLVKKRLDKLLDYEEIQERKSEMGSVTYDEEAAMNTYLAINALLVAELPRFNQAALQLLGQILCSFSALQRDLAAQVLHQAEKELEQVRVTPRCVCPNQCMC